MVRTVKLLSSVVLLFPFVSLSVAVILFEGGMTLKLKELRGVGRTLGLLIAIGGGATLGLGYLSAHYLLELDKQRCGEVLHELTELAVVGCAEISSAQRAALPGLAALLPGGGQEG